MYIERNIKKSILEATKEYPVIMVCGQRQVGKSTTLNHNKENNRRYVSFDDRNATRLAETDHALFSKLMVILFNWRVSKAPSILETIKDIVDKLGNDGKNNNGLFWLAGSQKFKTIKGISDSLAGRVSTGVRRAVAALCKKVQLMKVEKLQKGAIIDWPFLAKRCN